MITPQQRIVPAPAVIRYKLAVYDLAGRYPQAWLLDGLELSTSYDSLLYDFGPLLPSAGSYELSSSYDSILYDFGIREVVGWFLEAPS
jgi:hypothetical protein